jgi:O-antigen ligase
MPVVNNLLIAAIFAYCLFYNTPAEKWRLLRSRPAIILMLLFFLLQIISAAASTNRQEGLSMLALRSPLLVLPLSLGLITIRQALKLRILTAYCLATTLMAVFCLVRAGLKVWHTGDAEWLYDDSLTDIIGRQSVYIAFMVSVAVFGYLYLWWSSQQIPPARHIPPASISPTPIPPAELKPFAPFKNPWFIFPAIGVLLCFHYLLASRISIVFLYTALVLAAGWLALKRGNRRVLLGTCLLAILAVSCLHFFPKTLNRFRELRYTDYKFQNSGVESHYNMPVTSDQWNGANLRLAIWRCGLDMMPGNWITGVPLGDKRARLQAMYKTQGFEFAYRTRRNLHSTYLDVLVNTGIPGLCIFLLGYLVLPFWSAVSPALDQTRRISTHSDSLDQTRRISTHSDSLGQIRQTSARSNSPSYLSMAIVAAFAAAMLSETWIDRSFGCVLLGFWLSCISAWAAPFNVWKPIIPAPRNYPADTTSPPLPYPRNTPAPRVEDTQTGDSISGSSTSYGSPG